MLHLLRNSLDDSCEFCRHECPNTKLTLGFSMISGQIIIFHQPRFPWNRGISLPKRYLLGAQVVWGCWPFDPLIRGHDSPLKRSLKYPKKGTIAELPRNHLSHEIMGFQPLVNIELFQVRDPFSWPGSYRPVKRNSKSAGSQISACEKSGVYKFTTLELCSTHCSTWFVSTRNALFGLQPMKSSRRPIWPNLHRSIYTSPNKKRPEAMGRLESERWTLVKLRKVRTT